MCIESNSDQDTYDFVPNITQLQIQTAGPTTQLATGSIVVMEQQHVLAQPHMQYANGQHVAVWRI